MADAAEDEGVPFRFLCINTKARPARQFCCGCTLRTGVKIIGWLSVVQAVLICVFLAVVFGIFEHAKHNDPSVHIPSQQEQLFAASVVFLGLASVLDAAFGLCALLAAYKEDVAMANVAYFIIMCNLIISMVLLVARPSDFVSNCISILLGCYYTYILWSFKVALEFSLPIKDGPISVEMNTPAHQPLVDDSPADGSEA